MTICHGEKILFRFWLNAANITWAKTFWCCWCFFSLFFVVIEHIFPFVYFFCIFFFFFVNVYKKIKENSVCGNRRRLLTWLYTLRLLIHYQWLCGQLFKGKIKKIFLFCFYLLVVFIILHIIYTMGFLLICMPGSFQYCSLNVFLM